MAKLLIEHDCAINLVSTLPKKINDKYHVHLWEEKIKNKIVFQTPKMKSESDLCSNVDQTMLGYLETSTNDMKLVNKMNELDDNLFEYVKSKKEEWFPGKDISDAFLQTGQVHSIRQNKDNKAEYKMSLKTSKDVQIFDSEKTKISIEDLKKDNVVKLIIQLTGIWFTAQRWGAQWNILQIRKQIKKEPDRQYLFDENDSEDEDDDISPPPELEM